MVRNTLYLMAILRAGRVTVVTGIQAVGASEATCD